MEKIKIYYVENGEPHYLYDGENVLTVDGLTHEDSTEIYSEIINSLTNNDEPSGEYAFGINEQLMGVIYQDRTNEILRDKLFVFARSFTDVLTIYKQYTLEHKRDREAFPGVNTFTMTFPNYKAGIDYLMLMTMNDMVNKYNVPFEIIEKSFLGKIKGKLDDEDINSYMGYFKKCVTFDFDNGSSDQFLTAAHILSGIVDAIYEQKQFNDTQNGENDDNE